MVAALIEFRNHSSIVYYASRNIPASLKHFTFVVFINRSLNSSQCNMDARPPAEHPERRA